MRLDKYRLNQGRLREYQQRLFVLAEEYNAFIIIVQTETNKSFGFFVPSKFQEIGKNTDRQIAFYLIFNNQMLIVCKSRKKYPDFQSNHDQFIGIGGALQIFNNPKHQNWAFLYESYW